MKKIITLLIVCCSNMYAQDTFIHAGKIFDSKSGKTEKNKIWSNLPLRNATKYYNHQLERNPLVTKCVTSGFIAGIGDILCQKIVMRNSENDEDDDRGNGLDYARTCRFGFLGTFLIGGVLHYWYSVLNTVIVGNSAMAVLKRTCCDQLLMAPIFIATFMTSLSALENGRDTDLREIKEKLNNDWWDIIKTNWAVWVPAQAVNFGFIPPQYQVLFSNFIGLQWNIYLSYKTNGNDKQ